MASSQPPLTMVHTVHTLPSLACSRLLVPPLQVANAFEDGAETCNVVTSVLLSSSIGEVEEELISFTLSAWMRRQRVRDLLTPEAPVMDIGVNVGPISVAATQPQVAFIWRSAFAHVAEVKAAWSWQYAGGAPTSKSVLDIAPIRKLLDGAFEAAAERERQRQVADDRSGAHALDMRVRLSFEALTLSLLRITGARLPFACYVRLAFRYILII